MMRQIVRRATRKLKVYAIVFLLLFVAAQVFLPAPSPVQAAAHKVKRKYKNPVKVLKIGKRNYAKGFKKSDILILLNNSPTGKKRIKVVPAKGWKLKSIRLGYSHAADPPRRSKKIRNNKKINLHNNRLG